MKKIISMIISKLNSLNIDDHKKIYENDHINQLNNFFNTFHKYLKNYEILTDLNNENLVKNFDYWNKIESYKEERILLGDYINLNIEEEKKDFIISKSLKQRNKKDLKNIYELIPDLKIKIMKEIGFGYKYENKEIILKTFKNKTIKEGTFLGFFGGNVKKDNNECLNEKECFRVIKRPQGYIYNSENKLEYPNNILRKSKKNLNLNYIKLEELNFYSIFHKIKHANIEEEPNIVLLDVNIPLKYFPNYFYKYLPYNYEYKLKDKINIWGAFSTKSLNNGDKLYLDFWNSHILSLDELDKNKIPKWLCYHQNSNPFFNKKNYNNEIWNIFKLYKNEFIPENILDKEDIYKLIDENIIKIKKYENQLENKEKIHKLEK